MTVLFNFRPKNTLSTLSFIVISFVCLICHLKFGKKNITIDKVFLLTCGSYFLWSSLLFLYSDVRHTHQRVDDGFYLYKGILSCNNKP